MNGELGLGGGEDLQTHAVISDTQVTRDPISSGVKVGSSRKFPQAPNATHVELLNSLVLI